MKELRVILAGGGSGGHIYPLIAVAQELKKQSESFNLPLDMRYFGGARAYAQEIVDNDIEFVPILSSKLRRYFSPMNLIDIPKFFLSLVQLMWKLFWFMPDVVFSKGGPGAFAVVLVARFYLIPVVIHESDSIPGLTNKLSGIFSKKVFLAFSSARDYFKNKDVEIVGNPVRNSLFEQASSLTMTDENQYIQARKGLGLNLETPTILILGGSQGAERLNNFVLESLDILLDKYQILHQVGKRNFDSYKKEYDYISKNWSEDMKNKYLPRPFFNTDMSDVLIASDIVVTRAGSGTIFEIAAFGKPAILIPLPEAANDHQLENARFYSKTGAAVVIQQDNLLKSIFIEEINKLIQNKEMMAKMSEAAKVFYRPESAQLIARHLLTYVS
ncbi:UDP-N-acetylglucosamine--N-acetylmuramyl-(pentapeptide) pyrophosphoryl-undecaprenol N-acetylglucosamine transferase [Candidatus Wolfebacteria bacterium]|nr:UDP-N-acetylglucosamine--N-acetylmuramyl-(pentapeptide) pyrophosphoryl-undecaprenol N-acetylglucosamine transferase [Candidatus Wolfebacteria bacterium]